MSRPQRLAFVTAFLTVLAVLLGGLVRASEYGLAHGGVWSAGDALRAPEVGLGPIVSTVFVLVTVLTAALVLVTALATQRHGGSSRRSRRVAWLAAALQVAGLTIAQTLGTLWPAATQAAAPVLAVSLVGLTFLLCWSLAADRGAPAWLAATSQDGAYPRDNVLVWLTRVGLMALLMVIVSGAITATSSVALPCPSWPLCVESGLLPDQPTTAVWLHMGHRLLTIVAGVALFGITYRAWSRPSPRVVRQLSLSLVAVLVVQILLGGNLIVAGGPAWLDLLHLLAGIVLWLVAIALAIVAPRLTGTSHRDRPAVIAGGEGTGARGPVAPVPVAATANAAALAYPLTSPLGLSLPDYRDLRAIVADYVALMKPGILSLLLVTTFAAMLIAASGLPPFGLICITIVGGVLVAGGANVLNCYIDRDIDAQMARTRHRATASNRIPPSSALAFGIGLTGAAVLLLGVGANWVAALLALAGNLYYVLVYTWWLKRRTPQNVVIGGAAGAVPPLVGWAAVTGNLSPLAWMLFAIIFMWTPPHSWALALLKQGEYGRAAVPMLPVVAGEAATRRQIVIYTVLLFVVCLALVPLGLGPIYLAAAVLINAVFLGLALLLYWRPSKRHARQLFFGSLWYLALIFLAAVVDRLVIG